MDYQPRKQWWPGIGLWWLRLWAYSNIRIFIFVFRTVKRKKVAMWLYIAFECRFYAIKKFGLLPSSKEYGYLINTIFPVATCSPVLRVKKYIPGGNPCGCHLMDCFPGCWCWCIKSTWLPYWLKMVIVTSVDWSSWYSMVVEVVKWGIRSEQLPRLHEIHLPYIQLLSPPLYCIPGHSIPRLNNSTSLL